MANQGIAPANVTTTVGKLRYVIGDINYTQTTTGLGDYKYFSDQDLSNYLAMGADNPYRAAGQIYLQWAGIAASEAVNISDYDLRIDYTKRAADLRAQAEVYFRQADEDDALADSTDAVFIVPTGVRSWGHVEATPYQYGY